MNNKTNNKLKYTINTIKFLIFSVLYYFDIWFTAGTWVLISIGGYDISLFGCFLIGAFYSYILAKIFGIFRLFDKVNFFIALIIFFLLAPVSILFVEKTIYNLGIHEEYEYFAVFIVLSCMPYAYILNRIFKFLGKKFAICKTLGSFFSFEFYRELFLKFKNRKNENKDENKSEIESEKTD